MDHCKKRPEACCRKVSGSDHPILLGLFYPSATVSLFSPSPAAQSFFPFSPRMLFTHMTAFSPLMCLFFSLCFVGRTARCSFIAQWLLHFNSEFCRGKFRSLLTLLLLRVSLTTGSAPLFQHPWQPLCPRCRGDPNPAVSPRFTPAARLQVLGREWGLFQVFQQYCSSFWWPS